MLALMDNCHWIEEIALTLSSSHSDKASATIFQMFFNKMEFLRKVSVKTDKYWKIEVPTQKGWKTLEFSRENQKTVGEFERSE